MTGIEIIHRLEKKGYDAYLVGGAVRDRLLGIESNDDDIVTSADPDQIECIFSNQKIKLVGKSFRVVMVDGIEVSSYRTDHYNGLSDKNVTVTPAKTLEEDLTRRDLTINAMAMDSQGNLIDPHGGQHDLKIGLLRFVGDPKTRIWEDPNRIIRACRFRATFPGSRFSLFTYYAMKEYAHYIKEYVDPERIRKEIMKAMKIKRASYFFEALHEVEALIYIFPSLENCYMFPHGPHHGENVWVHNMVVGDYIKPQCPLLKLAAYLHDVGKPISAHIKPETNDFTFSDHNITGAKVAECELRKLTFSNSEIKYIKTIIREHMLLCREDSTPKAVRKFLRRMRDKKIHYMDFIRLRIADRKGNYNLPDLTRAEIQHLIEVIESQSVVEDKAFTLKLSGHDIMRELELKPGRVIGFIKNQLEEMVLENPDLNDMDNLLEILRGGEIEYEHP